MASDTVPDSVDESIPATDASHIHVQNRIAVVNGDASVEAEIDASQLKGAARTKRDSPNSCHLEEPQSKRVKRTPITTPDDSTEAATEETTESAPPPPINKETWQGFCEIESDPAYFSAILRDMGVRDVNVREVFALEPWSLDTLPTPVYGLILLYQYREHGSSSPAAEIPDDMWFANQLPAQNSCATLAMINILMNSEDVAIGEHLQQFKDFTKDLEPYQRGEALASFNFVKKIHNSFAKNMDILEADKHLSYKVKRAQSALKDRKGRRTSSDSVTTDYSAEGYEENAHHFIAFIPVGNEVWQLDGLNAQPIRVATFEAERSETWVGVAAESILALITDAGHEYSTIAITQSPLLPLRKQACLAVNTIQCVEARLDDIATDWRSSVDETPPPHPSVLEIEQQLELHPVPNNLASTIGSSDTTDLLKRRASTRAELEQLAASIASEVQTEVEDSQKADRRRFDCGPVIKLWAEMLAGTGYLEANLEPWMPGRGKKGKK